MPSLTATYCIRQAGPEAFYVVVTLSGEDAHALDRQPHEYGPRESRFLAERFAIRAAKRFAEIYPGSTTLIDPACPRTRETEAAA